MIKFILNKQIIKIAILICGLFCGLATHTKIYKFYDSSGNVQYHHRPPEDRKYETIEAEKPLKEKKPEAKIKKKIKKETYKSQLDKLENERIVMCKRAKQDKHILLNKLNITINLADGTKKRLNSHERQVKISEIDKLIKEYCENDFKHNQ